MADKKRPTKRTPKPEPIGDDGLTAKQRVFVDEYFACNLNATEAARRAGYSSKSVRSIASENLTKPNIQAVISQRLKEHQMGGDEVLTRLSALAMADMNDFITPSGRGFKIDLKKARELGRLHLIRKIKKDKQGTSIELYDVKDALVQLGRVHGLFTDRISGEIETLTPEQLEERRAERWKKAAPLLAAVLGNKAQSEATNDES